MSDAVHHALEEMIDELNYYKKHNIFDDNEINTIIEKRKSYEYKLQRSKKLLTDFLNYINYEKKLEAKIYKLTKSLNNRYIIKRISALYKRTLKHFNDPELVSLYITYLEKRGRFDDILYFFEIHTTKNPCDVEFVIFAAEKCLEYEEYAKGRVLLLKSARENASKKVLLTLCRFEMEYMKHCIAMNEQIGLKKVDYGDIENGNIVIAVIDDFVKQFGRCEELDEICGSLREYPHLCHSIDLIINK